MAKKTPYLTNKELLQELIPCRDAFLQSAKQLHQGINDPKKVRLILNEYSEEVGGSFMSEELARMFLLLVNRYAQKPNWRGYSYREDMESEALLMLVRQWWKFDPEASQNPFAYFTMIIHRSFLTYLSAQKKQSEIRDDILESKGYDPSHTRQSRNDEATLAKRLNQDPPE